MQENRHCVQFFQDLISSIQSACLKHIYCSVSVEVSGYLAIEIDSTRKERYVISELVHAGGTGTQRKRAAEPGQTSAQPKKGKQLQVKQEAEDTNYRRAATASEEDIVVVPVTGAESDEDICVLEASGSFVSADDDDDDCVIFAESTVPVRKEDGEDLPIGPIAHPLWAGADLGSRAKLKTKQDLLVEQGKGQGIPRFDMLTPQDVDTFYACGQLGTSSADSLINTLWFLLSIRFGFRMVWGDLHLQQDSEGQEQLVFTGMSGLTPVFRRAVTAEPNNTQRCLVAVYKRYRELRPPSILNPESPFYLAVNHPYGQDADRPCGMGQRRLTNSSIHSIINFRNNL
nr:hypothetical protein BaRGS_013993 [Batillaria attramentaria]